MGEIQLTFPIVLQEKHRFMKNKRTPMIVTWSLTEYTEELHHLCCTFDVQSDVLKLS